MRSRPTLLVLGAGLALLIGWQVWAGAQQPAAPQVDRLPARAAADLSRFEFEVVQSFDAKYQGDTPGHVGRAGGLDARRPNAALGDPVFRGNERVGTITGLAWSRPHGSLEVEFDPQPNIRVAVGDMVWIALDGPARPPGR
jgi:hypothetical protein